MLTFYSKGAGGQSSIVVDQSTIVLVGTASLNGSPIATDASVATPTITSFTNSQHTHANAAGGGTLDAAAIASGTIAPARLGSGSGGSTKFLREDSTFQALAGGGDAVVSGNLDQFADVTQTATKTLAITESTTLAGGTHSGTNTGDQTISTLCVKANNLSDLTNTTTARNNLALPQRLYQVTDATWNNTTTVTSTNLVVVIPNTKRYHILLVLFGVQAIVSRFKYQLTSAGTPTRVLLSQLKLLSGSFTHTPDTTINSSNNTAAVAGGFKIVAEGEIYNNTGADITITLQAAQFVAIAEVTTLYAASFIESKEVV